jgi:ABC-type transport system substrate-binding protein
MPNLLCRARTLLSLARRLYEVRWRVSNATKPPTFERLARRAPTALPVNAPVEPRDGSDGSYCDESLDAKMAKAAALQASDPVRADDLWAEVDHELVDQAVAVPWGSPGDRVLVSERVGNYQSHPLWGTLF